MRFLTHFVLIFGLAVCIDGQGQYIVLGPNTIQSESNYTISVAVKNTNENVKLKLSITGSNLNLKNIVHLNSIDSVKLINFEVPRLTSKDNYTLTVKGTKGLIFENTTTLRYKEKLPIVVIQTDKSFYRPGETVRYRMLCLNENLRPINNVSSILWIENPLGHRFAVKKNLQIVNGIYEDKFKLSKYTKLGKWFIKINSESLLFEVRHPKRVEFTVKVESPQQILLENSDFQVDVSASYTSGLPVNGRVHIEGLITSKKVDMFNGKSRINLTLSAFQTYKENPKWQKLAQLKAVVEDDSTGVTVNQSFSTLLTSRRYNFQCTDSRNCRQHHVGQETTYEFVVKNCDGMPINGLDNGNKSVRATFTEIIPKRPGYTRFRIFYQKNNSWNILLTAPTNRSFVYDSHLDEKGVAKFKVHLQSMPPLLPAAYYRLDLEYDGEKEYVTTLLKQNIVRTLDLNIGNESINDSNTEKLDSFFGITTNSQETKVGDLLAFTVFSSEPIKYFIYSISAKGNILETKEIVLPEPEISYTFTMMSKQSMVPESQILVYYIRENGTIIYDETEFNVELENKVNISASSENIRGGNITLEIHTLANSYVGLWAIDQSALETGENTYKEPEILRRLQQFHNHWNCISYPGQLGGLASLTNANHNCDVPQQESTTVDFNDSDQREQYGSWVFDITPSFSNTILRLTRTLPNATGDWNISAFSLNSDLGLGFADTKIHITRPEKLISLSLNLPFDVKRGEHIKIAPQVFNCFSEKVIVNITLENVNGSYELLDESNIKTVHIPANESTIVNFNIRTHTLGVVMLRLKATAGNTSETLDKSLEVVSEGITVYKNYASLVLLKEESKPHTDQFHLKYPTSLVPDSQKVELLAMGDLFAPEYESLEELITMKGGSGEEVVSKLIVNYLVYTHLSATGKLKFEMEERIKQNLESGYQHILHFRHKDGSFSLFGPGVSINGSTWLTAYVLRALLEISQIIVTDEKILTQSFNYLLKQQTADGNFLEWGDHFYNVATSNLTITANVVLSLLAYKQLPQMVLKHALEYLDVNVVNNNDSLSKSIAIYALDRAHWPGVVKHLQNMLELDNVLSMNDDLLSRELQTVAYTILTILDTKNPEPALPLIRWLILHRNKLGGFSSSQDTVVGLQALMKLSEAAQYAALTPKQNLSVRSMASLVFLKITEENKLLQQHAKLPQNITTIDYIVTGEGLALIEVAYQYNTIEKQQNSSFILDISVKKKGPPKRLSLEVCATYVSAKSHRSNLVIMELMLPSGYVINDADLEVIKQVNEVKIVDTRNENSIISIYLGSFMNNSRLCVPITAYRDFEVTFLKPSWIVIYDYFDVKSTAQNYYEV